MQQAAARASGTFRASAAASGAWETQQIKIRSATEAYTEALDRQKISFKDWRKNMGVAKAAYQEQLRLQEMVARRLPINGPNGKGVWDIAIPTVANKNLDTFGRKVGWAREQLRSFSTQMVNSGKNMQWAGRQLMVGFTLPVVAFGAAAGVAAYKVDKELTRIQKVYDTTTQVIGGDQRAMAMQERELANVRVDALNTARNAAQQYGSSAEDTLSIQADLAATGLQGIKLQEATNQVMRISTLGELDRQEALDATITMQSVFKMSNKELADSFNYMNSVENATSLQLKDFATAIPIAAGPVKAFGGDIYELGVLMTAMRERGIQAAQGANALKATMQRLSRPSKQIKEEFAALTNGGDIEKLVDESGSLMEIFTKLGNITRGLGDDAKRDIYAGLFGGFQVTRMTALVEGMQDVQKGVGQAGKAFELAKGDATDWANTADGEIEKIRNSISGKFNIALQSMKIELATMGEPFVKAATIIIKAVTTVVKAFNDLPGIIKQFIAWPLVILAVAGPLIMLGGLFQNFLGNAGKAIYALTGFLGKMGLMTKESALGQAAARLASEGYADEAKSVAYLTAELQKLIVAEQEARAAASGMIAPSTGPVQGPALAPLRPGQGRVSTGYVSGTAGTTSFIGGIGGATQAANPAVSGGMSRAVQIQTQLAAADRARLSNQVALNQAAMAENTIRTRSQRLITGQGVATAAMAASMGLMLTNSSATAHTMGQLLLVVALVGPALGGMVTGIGKFVALTKTAIAAQLVLGRATMASAVGMGRVAGASAAAGAAMRGVGAGMAALMGPVGWTMTAVAAIGFGVFKWWQHQKAITEEQKKQQSAIANSTTAYQDLLDVQKRSLATLREVNNAAGQGKLNPVGMAEELTKSETGKNLVSAYKDSDDKSLIAQRVYLDTLNSIGGSAEKAQRAVEALFIAAGEDSVDATAKAGELSSLLGSIGDNSEFDQTWADSLRNSMDDSVEAMDVTADKMADIFADGLARADKKGADEVRSTMDRYINVLLKNWDALFAELDDTQTATLARLGVDTGAEMKDFFNDMQTMTDEDLELKWHLDPGQAALAMQAFQQATRGVTEEAQKLQRQEDVIASKLAKQLGVSKEINTMQELRATSQFKLMEVQKGGAQLLYDQLVREAELSDSSKDVTDETRLQYLNMVRVALGLEKTNNLQDLFKGGVQDTNNNIDDTERKVRSVQGALWGVNKVIGQISNQDFGNSFKDAMTGVQQRMADDIHANFSRQMDAAIANVEAQGESQMDAFDARSERASTALENRQEAATKALERRQEAATTALERRQEARRKAIEDSYDRRVKSIENAIEAEQKAEEIRKRIFDAEMTRLDRLNTEQNRNIDFNVALNSGDLDEAARIRNDMMAQESQWSLEDASTKGERGSDKRVKNLEDRRDAVEKARDNELEALSKVEDAEKKSLDRRLKRQEEMLKKRQEAQSNYLQKNQEAERKALEDSIQANAEAERTKWQDREANLEKSLEDFTNYVAYNEKDLRRHIKTWRSEHKDLSQYTKGQFDITAGKINQEITHSVHDAMRKMRNDIQWENNGAKIAKGMVHGAFGLTMGQFKKWMLTGKYPKNADKPQHPGTNGKGPASPTDRHYNQTAHTGGFLGGSGINNRKGVARTAPLHPSETIVRARRGEFMVNEKATSENRGLLEAINSGRFNAPTDVAPHKRNMRNKRNTGGFTGPMGLGFSGVMAGLMAAGVKTAINNAVQVGAAEGRAKQAALAMSGIFSAGGPGTYGGRAYGKEQMKNAATIANVGSTMHMSKRDIEIGIMTAITESGLINLNYGDRDSVGLFQQRTSQGWGSIAELMQPEIAARKFFAALRAVSGRDSMQPWMAAQAVQKSYADDGSNYLPFWDDAKGIFGSLKHSGGSAGAGYVPGKGGTHKPVLGYRTSQGIHDSYTGFPAVDLSVPVGSKVYAVAGGKITRSEDLKGHEDRLPDDQQNGYYSYGRLIQQSVPGGEVLYAHLSSRAVRVGQMVKGGAVIARSGNTGHSYGPHLHFGARPMSPYAFLKSGGTVKKDGTPAILHKKETVLTEPLSEKLKSAIGNLNQLSSLEKLDRLAASMVTNTEYTNLAIKNVEKATRNSVPGTGGPSSLRVGGYNVFRKASNANSKDDLTRLMNITDVMSLSEMIGGKRNLIPWIKNQGWGYFGNQGRANDTAITWNAAKYSLEDKGTQPLTSPAARNGSSRNRGATYGLLRNRETGARFWQVAAHTIGHAQRSLSNWREVMNDQYADLNELIKRLNGSGLPVVLAGDLNTNAAKSGLNTHFAGMRDITGKKGLDRIFTSRSLKKSTVRRVGYLASDHPALVSQLKIPGLSSGGFTLNDGYAKLHANEAVLTAPLTKQLINGIERLDTGSNATYNVNVYSYPGMNEDVLINKTMTAIRRHEQRLPGSRRN